MPVLKPFKRTARPQADGDYLHHCHYIKHPKYAIAPAQYIRAFHILQKDLLHLFDYVEPADKNNKCYSYRIHELHTRACIEVEANCKAILTENSYKKKANDLTMSDYKKLETTHHLSSYKVRLPIWHGDNKPRRPFAGWKVNKSLPWYQAHKIAKHPRHVNFDKSNFQNMLDSMCGLVALLAAQFIIEDFGPEGYIRDSSLEPGYEIAIGGYFEVKFPDDWPKRERYSFDWGELQSDPDPFQSLTF
jgi:hypothetical protein